MKLLHEAWFLLVFNKIVVDEMLNYWDIQNEHDEISVGLGYSYITLIRAMTFKVVAYHCHHFQQHTILWLLDQIKNCLVWLAIAYYGSYKRSKSPSNHGNRVYILNT